MSHPAAAPLGQSALDGVDFADLFSQESAAAAACDDVDDASALAALAAFQSSQPDSAAAPRLPPPVSASALLRALGELGDPRALGVCAAVGGRVGSSPLFGARQPAFTSAHLSRMPVFLRVLVLSVSAESTAAAAPAAAAAGARPEGGRCVLGLALRGDAAAPRGLRPLLLALCLRGDWLSGAETLRANAVLHVVAAVRGAPASSWCRPSGRKMAPTLLHQARAPGRAGCRPPRGRASPSSAS